MRQYNVIMGSCQPELYHGDNWKEVGPNILRNVDTLEEMEIHQHEFDTRYKREFVTAYVLRRTPVPPFVRVLDYQLKKGWWSGGTAVTYT